MKNTLFIVLSYIAKSLMVLASVCYGSACIVMIIEAMMHSWEEINTYNYIFPSDLIAISAYMLIILTLSVIIGAILWIVMKVTFIEITVIENEIRKLTNNRKFPF